jgi:catechol 2,3-dioxygenase-like lactoylglutathione lyase family enzyme
VIQKVKITPILFVESIEASLSFWEARLGFTRTVELPTGNKLGFVILTHGDTEVMLQTRESVAGDLPELEHLAEPRGGIYIEVDDFKDLLQRIEGVEVVVPVRTTFYGMTEVVVREPGGNTIAFAGKTEARGT